MKITKKAVLAIMCLSLAAFAPGKAHAANKVQIPDGACRKGNDIYYSYSGSGLRMDLMKINTKTHKKKMIVSNKYKGRTTNGFFDLNIKGNNIYATYNIVDGSDGFNCYICKINVKKKTKKLLTKGHHPIVIGNKIYFVKTKYNKTIFQDEDKGIYVMNLSGKYVKCRHHPTFTPLAHTENHWYTSTQIPIRNVSTHVCPNKANGLVTSIQTTP